MTPRREGGFTLIEVLIAVSIIGIIFAFILSVLTTSISQSRAAERRMDIGHAGRFFVQKISVELTCASLFPLSGRGGLLGKHFTRNGKSRDEIHFTMYGQSYFTGRPRSGVSEVSYFFRTNKQGAEALARREADTVEDPIDAGGEVYELSREVEELSIKYRKGAEWKNTWDSKSESALPEEVSVELRLNDGGQSYLFSTVARPQT